MPVRQTPSRRTACRGAVRTLNADWLLALLTAWCGSTGYLCQAGTPGAITPDAPDSPVIPSPFSPTTHHHIASSTPALLSAPHHLFSIHLSNSSCGFPSPSSPSSSPTASHSVLSVAPFFFDPPFHLSASTTDPVPGPILPSRRRHKSDIQHTSTHIHTNVTDRGIRASLRPIASTSAAHHRHLLHPGLASPRSSHAHAHKLLVHLGHINAQTRVVPLPLLEILIPSTFKDV